MILQNDKTICHSSTSGEDGRFIRWPRNNVLTFNPPIRTTTDALTILTSCTRGNARSKDMAMMKKLLLLRIRLNAHAFPTLSVMRPKRCQVLCSL